MSAPEPLVKSDEKTRRNSQILYVLRGFVSRQ